LAWSALELKMGSNPLGAPTHASNPKAQWGLPLRETTPIILNLEAYGLPSLKESYDYHLGMCMAN
jgi:hypothetical protein